MKNRLFINLKIHFKKNKLALISSIILGIIILSSLLAFLSPYDPNKINVSNKLASPSIQHIFGTDELGRDYFTRALYGGRISLKVGFLSMLVSISLGTIIGVISGYLGGLVDSLIMRIIDVLMCIPTFFLILIANAYLEPNINNIIAIIGLFGWMGVARVVRSETLSYKQREYVLCSKSLGASNFHIIFKHIIPDVISSVIVMSTLNIAGAILTESSLSFLGLGVQQPMASWGSMLQNAQGYITDKPHMAIFPGMFILLTVLSFNVLGDTLRITLDPKIDQEI
ncbi:ABC transporter permease [Haloimpatiens massiliensis]|uniref:ABC transporter permease n=1 Tax=Haloimpatiens massiliensis TaxID=1658110 RepID=UPI000C84812F|nr:ABC transporter permease [Haloimpatiens massiliensis]